MSLSRWIVLEPPSAPGMSDAAGRSSEARFVKDRFAPLGFVFTALWLYVNRLWIAGSIALVAIAGLAWLGTVPGFGTLAAVTEFGIALLIGLEGRNLVAGKWRRRGWRDAAVVMAGSRREAELRYFAGAAPRFDAGLPNSAPEPARSAQSGMASISLPAFRLPWNRERSRTMPPPLPDMKGT